MIGSKRIPVGFVRILASTLLCLCIFGSIVYVVFFGFDVEHIEFQGIGMKAEINEQRITGNLIFFPSDKVKADLLKEYPQLSDVIIKKQFPHTITIIPVLRMPAALLITSKAIYGIDKEGKILGLGYTDSTLPEIHREVSPVVVGQTVKDKPILYVLVFLEKSIPILPVSSVFIDDEGLSLRAVSDKTEILFTQEQSIDTLMASLQTIVTGVRMKGTMPKLIDVRFIKPVIQW